MDRTNYGIIYEAQYQQLQQQAAEGWNTQQIAQDNWLKVARALQNRQIAKGRILEVGCGEGNLTRLVAQQGYETDGIDISPTAIQWAKGQNEGMSRQPNFRVGSVLALPYQDEMFEVIIDGLCLHCIIGSDRNLFLTEVYRVLKSQGVLIVMTKCGNPKRADYPFDGVSRCKVVDGVAVRYWGLAETIRREVEGAGFAVNRWEIYDYDDGDQLVLEAMKP